MKTSDFYYDLPEELIAQTPLLQRDSSRLMVLDRKTGAVSHRHFYNVIDYLNEGDVLVIPNLNNINDFMMKDPYNDVLVENDGKPKPKAKTEKRKANEAVIGDTRFKIDKENHVIKLSTESENTLWQAFSVYRIPTTNDYIQVKFNNNEFLNY